MRRIIKHANRRLYDTEKRAAITLLELSDLALRGTEIVVLDKASGEDITAQVLVQSILERLRRRPGAVVRPGDTRRLMDALERAIVSRAEGSELFDAEPESALTGRAGTARSAV
ncbi:MAG: hypothetical protein JXB46_09875 [Candidatus Eisenbacteria bacterium]|nr:hypothetical protein [Candidatus Eisenbacteria bacterium]